MSITTTEASLAHRQVDVNPRAGTPRRLPPDTMIHHNSRSPHITGYDLLEIRERGKRYGVSFDNRILTRGLFLKKYGSIRGCLRDVLGLTVHQVEVTLRLLRLWAYYGQVYPTAASVAGEYCPTAAQTAWRASVGLGVPPRRGEIGRATVWRTIARLEGRGLIQRVNRFLVRPHAQISNLYRLDKLLVVIAKYLAERGRCAWPAWLKRIILLAWPQFWGTLHQEFRPRDGPAGGVYTASA